MDLIYIARKYKNKRVLLIVILVILLLIYTILASKNISNKRKELEKQTAKTQAEISENEAETEVSNNNKGRVVQLTETGKNNIENIYKSEAKRVFLTFDDGPSKKITVPILDLLKEQDIKASFFVLGNRVELYPDIVKREYEEGHYIANHGYSHVYSQVYSSVQSVLDEYNKTNDCIKIASGNGEYNSNIFRFPGGLKGGKYIELKQEAANLLRDNNIAYVDWNALSGDAEGITDIDALVERVKQTTANKNSVVLLMHDAGDKTYTLDALPRIIEYLREEGYEFLNFYDIMSP